jgi:hypothetical protein
MGIYVFFEKFNKITKNEKIFFYDINNTNFLNINASIIIYIKKYRIKGIIILKIEIKQRNCLTIIITQKHFRRSTMSMNILCLSKRLHVFKIQNFIYILNKLS